MNLYRVRFRTGPNMAWYDEVFSDPEQVKVFVASLFLENPAMEVSTDIIRDPSKPAWRDCRSHLEK